MISVFEPRIDLCKCCLTREISFRSYDRPHSFRAIQTFCAYGHALAVTKLIFPVVVLDMPKDCADRLRDRSACEVVQILRMEE